ncbi:aldolase/citrate lyase family protein [Planomicrobium okeanokoites]|uniref:aldolase/citrate lyase family protein n=1 Tax=Planomicrobium okeanokoites TaxID=244 RepID=UPI0024935291|nr:aldolase/citrate lyase family protein [Planomicrobium okeanokoites]
MFESFIFIPASEKKFISKSENFEVEISRIFDFEDSINEYEVDDSLKNLVKINFRANDWIRLPFDIEQARIIVEDIVNISNFIIPKFKNSAELILFINMIKENQHNPKLILLIENAHAYNNINEILKQVKTYIYGVGLGSHDFAFETGIKNNSEYLRSIRINLLIIAKSHQIKPIDFVSRSIDNESEFIADLLEGFNCGYRSKFMINPKQITLTNKHPFFTKQEIEFFREVLNFYNVELQSKSAVFKYKGVLYEKMHLKSFNKFLQWGDKFYE